jgi:hypothetical protein
MTDPGQLWSSLPAILTDYDQETQKGTVRSLVKMRYKDGSQIDFPDIRNVLIVMPATAYAGMLLPVRIGDKVTLHIQDRDIQRLLFKTDTSGTQDPGSQFSDTSRIHDLTDCIAYTGFSSFDNAKGSDQDVWIFNNDDGDSYNHIRLKSTGDIELKTLNTQVTLTKAGQLDITAPNSVNITSPTVNMTGNLNVQGTIHGVTQVKAGTPGVNLTTHKHSPTGSAPLNPS